MSFEGERIVATHAVLKACWLCEKVRSSPSSGEGILKNDSTPVTVADFDQDGVRHE